MKAAKQKLSDFIMFEKAPYEKPDLRNIMEIHTGGAKEREKVYGPAFTAEFIKYTLRTAEKQTGENPPQDIKTLDQLKEYLISISEKLSSPPYLILIGAEYVIDKKFEGSQAAGTQLMFRGVTKRVVESDSNMKQFPRADVDQTLTKLRQLAVGMKIAPLEFGYKMNEDNSVDVFHGGCFYLKGCQTSLEHGLLKRKDGRMACGASSFVCQFLKMGTKYEWDYTILEFSETHCIVNCFMI
ncbi:MAG: hypothetical protein WED07_00060 [Candidatus Freyarchaeum deiterrae]